MQFSFLLFQRRVKTSEEKEIFIILCNLKNLFDDELIFPIILLGCWKGLNNPSINVYDYIRINHPCSDKMLQPKL